MRMPLRILVALALVAALATPVAANGRSPASIKVVFRPGSTSEILVGTTFGMLKTTDDGATWRWLCDSVVGIMGTYDPDYEMTSTGLMLATSYDGVYTSRDGCTWTKPDGPLGTGTTSSIAVASNGWIYVALSDPVAGYKIFKSTDDGASFQEVPGTLPASDWWNSIEVAPSDPDRIYLTGFRFNGQDPRSRILIRSTDGGQSWEELPTTAFVGTNNSDLMIAAIHPTDPDTVFVRMTLTGTTLQEKIYRTTTGGAALPAGPTWTEVLQAGDYLAQVAIRDNGDVYVPSMMLQKLHKSVDGGATFAEVPGVTYQSACVAERREDDRLFLCANNQIGSEPLTYLASSTTGAAGSWTSRLRFVDVVGPLRCAAGTIQHDDCEANLWCGQREQLGATSTEIDCAPPVEGDDTAPQPPPKSCCGIGGAPGLESASALVVLVFRPWRRRRRRDRAARA
ncbi:MAG TPA: hypothetical protein VM734_07920 [Kofleriaceae bacterium]|nr:hypothetical protein [Kofleriaceae bacterium]